MPTTILSFFDETNIEHLKAYRFLEVHGHWPEGFLPCAIEIPNMWQLALAGRLADAYLKSKLGDK